LEGPVFKLSNGTQFYLRFDPTSKKSDVSKEYCSLFLIPKDFVGFKSVKLEYRLWIENSFGENPEDYNEVISHTFDSLKGHGYHELVHHSHLYGPTANFVKDDVVILCCEVQAIKPSKRVLPQSEFDLREKLYSFYGRASSDNCTIQVGERIFNVSKSVLISRSNVFDCMFNSATKEALENKVTISDVGPETMECFIRYLYLGKLDNLKEMAKDLFYLADKYDVKDLKEECVESLSEGFNTDNVLERLQLAFKHNDEVLKQAILDYVCSKTSDGNFNYIMKTDEWTSLMLESKQLADEIVDAVFSKIY